MYSVTIKDIKDLCELASESDHRDYEMKQHRKDKKADEFHLDKKGEIGFKRNLLSSPK